MLGRQEAVQLRLLRLVRIFPKFGFKNGSLEVDQARDHRGVCGRVAGHDDPEANECDGQPMAPVQFTT